MAVLSKQNGGVMFILEGKRLHREATAFLGKEYIK